MDIQREKLIQRVAFVEPILDVLLREKVIHQEAYNRILTNAVPQDRMRALYLILGSEGNTKSKQIFFQALKDKEPMLMEDLEGL